MIPVKSILRLTYIIVLLLKRNDVVRGDATPTKIKVFVAFEAANKESQSFLLSQLDPIYNALFDVMDLNVVPFGGSQFDLENRMVTCVNGPAECKAHAYERCAMAKFPDPGEYLNFLSLVSLLPLVIMESDIAYDKCASLSGLDGSVISQCVNDAESSFALLHESARATPIYASHFPWVEVNDELVDVTAGESIWDAVCDALLEDDDETNDLPFCMGGDVSVGEPRKYKGINAADLFSTQNHVTKHNTIPLII